MLVAFYFFRFVELVTPAPVTAMRVRMADPASTVRRIVKYRLSRFAVGTGYNEVPIERLTRF